MFLSLQLLILPWLPLLFVVFLCSIVFSNSLDLYPTWAIQSAIFFHRDIINILFPLWLWEQLSGFMRTVAVRGHSGVLVLLCFICVWGIQTSVEKNPNATRRQVGLDANNLLPPPQVCQMQTCLWWGYLRMSGLLKPAVEMKVKVCLFCGDDQFRMCCGAGRLQLSLICENLAYKAPCASEIGVAPLKMTEWLFPAYSGLRRQKTWLIRSYLTQQWICCGEKILPVGLFWCQSLCFWGSSSLQLLTLSVCALKTLWYPLLRETLSQLGPQDFIWNQWSLPKILAGVGVCFTSAASWLCRVSCNLGTDYIHLGAANPPIFSCNSPTSLEKMYKISPSSYQNNPQLGSWKCKLQWEVTSGVL